MDSIEGLNKIEYERKIDAMKMKIEKYPDEV